MNLLDKIQKLCSYINLKTLYFNFYYLPFKQAIKLPILVSNNTYLKKAKGKIIIQDSEVTFGMIKIGKSGVGIFDEKKSRSIWQVSGQVVFKGKCNIGQGSKISISPTGKITFGYNFIITAESQLICNNEISFGNNCLLSWEILIMDTDSHKIYLNQNIINSSKPIKIKDNVWIGCRTTILKGSVIETGCIIGANSLINKKLTNKNSIYAGIPCSLIKENISWDY